MTPNFIWMHVIVGQSGQQPNPHIDFLKKTVFLSLHGLNKVPGKNMQTSQVDSSTLLSWDHGSVFPERSWWYSRKGVLMNSYRIPHRNGPTILWFCVIGVCGGVCEKSMDSFETPIPIQKFMRGVFGHRTFWDRSIIPSYWDQCDATCSNCSTSLFTSPSGEANDGIQVHK